MTSPSNVRLDRECEATYADFYGEDPKALIYFVDCFFHISGILVAGKFGAILMDYVGEW